MKNILFLFVILVFAFFSCDGKDRVHLSNAEVLKEHKLIDSFSENIIYIPNSYSEVITDTITSNGFKIKIKAMTDMSYSVLKSSKTDTLTNKTFYRNKKAQVDITKDNLLIFSKTIDHNFVREEIDGINNTLENFVLTEGFINYDNFYFNQKLVLSLTYKNYNTNKIKGYNLIIDETGNYQIIERLDC